MKKFTPELLGKHLATSGQKISFLVGSGFSASADIPTGEKIAAKAYEIIQANPLLRMNFDDADRSNYSALLEAIGGVKDCYDFLKTFIDKSYDSETNSYKINWAHLMLAVLVSARKVKFILTTNFDPLIIEALATMGQRVRVYDVSASGGSYARGTLEDGSVVYLHGQIHCHLLANVSEDFKKIKGACGDLLKEALSESVLVVSGYSGIADPVNDILKGCAPYSHGVYWSEFKSIESVDLGGLNEHAHYSFGCSSDDFMHKLVVEGLGFDLPEIVMNPLQHLKKSLSKVLPYKSWGDVKVSVNGLSYDLDLDEPRDVPLAIDGQHEDVVGIARKWVDGVIVNSPQRMIIKITMARDAGNIDLLMSYSDEVVCMRDALVSSQFSLALILCYSRFFTGKSFDLMAQVEALVLIHDLNAKSSWMLLFAKGCTFHRLSVLGDGQRRDVNLLMQAVDCFRRSILINPSSQAYNSLGNVYADLSKNKMIGFTEYVSVMESRDCYLEAIKLDPTSSILYRNAGDAMMKLYCSDTKYPDHDKMIVDALGCFCKAMELGDNSMRLNNNYALTLMEVIKGEVDFDKRGRLYRSAVELLCNNLSKTYERHYAHGNLATLSIEYATALPDLVEMRGVLMFAYYHARCAIRLDRNHCLYYISCASVLRLIAINFCSLRVKRLLFKLAFNKLRLIVSDSMVVNDYVHMHIEVARLHLAMSMIDGFSVRENVDLAKESLKLIDRHLYDPFLRIAPIADILCIFMLDCGRRDFDELKCIRNRDEFWAFISRADNADVYKSMDECMKSFFGYFVLIFKTLNN